MLLSDLLETSSASQADQAGHRRLRFSFFADEHAFSRLAAYVAGTPRKGAITRVRTLGVKAFGPVAQVVRAHP
jgi:hypothetical protein